MAVRPKRKNPISTRPIYLPKVPAKELREAAKGNAPPPSEGAGVHIYIDGGLGRSQVEGMAQRLGRPQGLDVTVQSEIVSVLAGRAHGEVRDAVAGAANRLAWARISDVGKQDYRVLPLRGEVDQEEAGLRARPHPEYEGINAPSAQAGVVYDAGEVQAAFRELLPRDGDATYVVATTRGLASWDESAKKWAPLAVLPGDPVLVTASGDGAIDAEAVAAEVGAALK